MMIRVYIAAAFVAVLFFAYWAGGNVARRDCRADVADNTTANIISTLQQQRKIDEDVIKTDTDDIRRVLRAQYTIAE